MCQAGVTSAYSSLKIIAFSGSHFRFVNSKVIILQRANIFPSTLKTKVFSSKGISSVVPLKERQYSLKCDPEKAIALREEYTEVTPAWHMNKKHWNSVSFEGDLSDKQIEEWIVDSYNLVVNKMPKKLKIELEKF